MAIVSGKCTSCGAILKVDNERDAMICEYCGTPYIVEKAIRYYKGEKDFVINAGVLVKYTGEDLDVKIPDNVVCIGKEAFKGMRFLSSVVLPDCVEEIEDSAFSGCESIRKIKIPDSVKSIGNGVFQGCIGLVSVEIGNGINEISFQMFSGCVKLANVIIPDSVQKVQGAAYKDCSSLTEMVIPDNVSYIGAEAFKGCIGLKSVKLGKNVKQLGDRVFHGCNDLSCIYVDGYKKEDECYVFPDKLNCFGRFILSHLPKKIVFLHEEKLGIFLDRPYYYENLSHQYEKIKNCKVEYRDALLDLNVERMDEANEEEIDCDYEPEDDEAAPTISVKHISNDEIVFYEPDSKDPCNEKKFKEYRWKIEGTPLGGVDGYEYTTKELSPIVRPGTPVKVQYLKGGQSRKKGADLAKSKRQKEKAAIDWLKQEEKRKEAQRKDWKRQGRCQYCGGFFPTTIFITPKCKWCGHKKDYN